VTREGTIPRVVGLQILENKALSQDIIEKSVPILAESTIRKSQIFYLLPHKTHILTLENMHITRSTGHIVVRFLK